MKLLMHQKKVKPLPMLLEKMILLPKEKIEIARKMHFEYNASGRQIRSILKLEQHIVDEMFPTR